ncbi:MAG TPA: hypothetical protein VMR21_06585 [Vicinamibacteria bacterium]|nr:hypothetical protein [Vicinamibacteria bacterium]
MTPVLHDRVRGPRAAALAAFLVAGTPVLLQGQPVTVAGGQITLAGETALTLGPTDRWFFNYTDYRHSALRLARFDLGAAWRPAEQVEVLGDLRTENFDQLRVHALYVRVRPWPRRTFDLQAGRIPPAFGAYARRSYAADSPLVGYPLAYQYLTSLRPDALPATAGDLLRMRGRGWLSSFPVGSAAPAPGMPLVSAFRWDTGIQARVGSSPVELLAAVTTGTLSSPRLRDDNDGKQVSARVAVRPLVGLVLGVSAARGAYLSDSLGAVLDGAAGGGTARQMAWGADLEYSRGYWLARAEGVWSAWDLPLRSDPALRSPLRARGLMLEGRYKIRPGLYLAARADHLGFSRVAGTPWEAPVRRLEAGAGYSLRRNVLLKAVYQHSRREGTTASLSALAGQLVVWF